MAIAATAAGLDVIGHRLDGGESVLLHGPLDLLVGHAKTFADDLAVDFLLGFAAVMGDGLFHGVATHYRTVHFLFGQSAQVIGDVLVGHLGRLVQGHSLDDFGQGRRGGNGTGTSEGLKLSVGNASVRAQLEGKLQRIAAGQRADFADTVVIVYETDVARVEKMVFDFIGIVPHVNLQGRHWSCFMASGSWIVRTGASQRRSNRLFLL